MQLNGSRIRIKNQLHQRTLMFLWKENKLAEASKLEVIALAASGRKKDAVECYYQYLDHEFPERQDKREKHVARSKRILETIRRKKG